MVKYWWVNQSDSYEKERPKGVIAARVSATSRPTHWGRANVQDINQGDFIVCYRSGIGIDSLGYVIKNLDKCDAIKIWEYEGDTGKAFTARVDYIPKMKPIEKKVFWDDLKDIANFDEKRGPIDNRQNKIRYAYAMELREEGFEKIIDLAERRNPGTIKWVQERQIG